MPKFLMDDLKKAMGYSDDVHWTSSVTSNSEKSEKGLTRVGRLQGRTPEETKTLIKNVLAEATEPMTRGEIFKAIERKNTPHLRNILGEMVASGDVIEETGLSVSLTMVRYLYSLPR